MSISSSQRIACLLLSSLFHIQGVFGRGGAKGIGKGIGDTVGAGSDLGLPPFLTAVFALTVTIAIITLYQMGYALNRFKTIQLPEGEPTLPYDVGTLFRVFLASYTVIYLLSNILYAIYIASFGDTFFVADSFQTGTVFTAQFAIVLFYATLLSIIAYRQRIQFNPGENRLTLKTFLDVWLLTVILVLAIAQAALFATTHSLKDRIALSNLALAFEVFGLVASLDVAISSFMARARFSEAGIQDKIIDISAFAVSPIVLTGGIFRIINIGIQRNAERFFNFKGLLIAAVVIEGIVSIAAVACCLLMGKPPKPSKSGHKGGAIGEKA